MCRSRLVAQPLARTMDDPRQSCVSDAQTGQWPGTWSHQGLSNPDWDKAASCCREWYKSAKASSGQSVRGQQ